LTAPLREIARRLSGERDIGAAWLQCATAEEAEALVCKLYQSRSWRIAGPARFIKRLLNRFFHAWRAR
jgi:hypothetical protein